MKTIFEPFRIKTVEPIRLTTQEERCRLIQAVNFNLFSLHSDDIMIDLLTDSGTSAMSSNQWAAIMRGDESYAGSPSFYRFEKAVKNLMPFKHVIPTHQGRAAEAILFSLLGGPGKRIPSNTHLIQPAVTLRQPARSRMTSSLRLVKIHPCTIRSKVIWI